MGELFNMGEMGGGCEMSQEGLSEGESVPEFVKGNNIISPEVQSILFCCVSGWILIGCIMWG